MNTNASGMNEIRELTDYELHSVAGGSTKLGGYTVCSDGLYVGGCPPTAKDVWNTFCQAAGVPQAMAK